MKETDRKVCRVVMIGSYSKGTNGRTCTSSSIKSTHYWFVYNMIDDLIKKNNKNTEKFLILSKSVHDFRETNSLFICNMVTHKARKVLCEKVQVDATVRDSNL